ncbi:hypothetical protein AgCh_038677 [Apium graveolens]
MSLDLIQGYSRWSVLNSQGNIPQVQKGFVHIAMQKGCPIVPFSGIGQMPRTCVPARKTTVGRIQGRVQTPLLFGSYEAGSVILVRLVLGLVHEKQKGMTKSKFIPKYILKDNSVADMPKEEEQLIEQLGSKPISFSPDAKNYGLIQLDYLNLSRCKISDLKATIYQINESSQELRDIKQILKMYLNIAEENVLK